MGGRCRGEVGCAHDREFRSILIVCVVGIDLVVGLCVSIEFERH